MQPLPPPGASGQPPAPGTPRPPSRAPCQPPQRREVKPATCTSVPWHFAQQPQRKRRAAAAAAAVAALQQGHHETSLIDLRYLIEDLYLHFELIPTPRVLLRGSGIPCVTLPSLSLRQSIQLTLDQPTRFRVDRSQPCAESCSPHSCWWRSPVAWPLPLVSRPQDLLRGRRAL